MATEQDPRGWLEACPELLQFSTDPRVGAAIAAGDGARLFAALEARRRGPRAAFEGRALDAILRRRRLFLSPVAKAPRLHTVNGFGTAMYGRSDVAPDGTYVGTLFATALFAPVWPVAQYLVHSSGRTYQFFGKVPLSRAMRRWRAGVAALAAVAAVGVGGGVWVASGETAAFVVNGLDVPVSVKGALGPAPTVPAGGRVAVRLRTGRQRLEASAGGRTFEAIDVTVPRFTDAVVYNPLGAAPLYAEGVYYFPEGAKPANEPEPPFELLTGRSFVSRDHVADVFAAAPQTIKLGSNATRELRWRVDVAPGGWRTTAAKLEGDGDLAAAAALAARVAAAEPGNAEVLQRWLGLAHLAGGAAAAIAPAQAIAEAAPDDVDAQRLYAHFLVAAGRRDEAERQFAARAEEHPHDVKLAYLRARVAPPERVPSLFAALARAHPESPLVRRAVAWQDYAARRWADALGEYATLARIDAGAARRSTRMVAISLAALGKPREALARVDAAADAALDLQTALLHAQLARLVPSAPPPDRYLARLGQDERDEVDRKAWRTYARVWGHVVAGGAAPDRAEIAALPYATQRDACRIMLAAAADPAEALRLAAQARRPVLAEVDDVVALLLAGEAARLGQDGLAVALAEASGHLEAPGREVVAFVRGEAAPELEDAEPEQRAALVLARARAAQAAGRDPSALLAEVRRADPLRGAVALALARWPAPPAGGR